ncbi:SusC/RagA family TonB-linked outer membrane protein [Polaribacter sp. IC073]|uniref:SusC/RagA family TonB-linked outer membrane protein n=1 Tax=Polaribacter sp. IC073 TaxID=2508540 RepID=UPI0011BE7097|nr:SusC/RagA family TonB-linked outer membrane protein [Polaribacter sp. IC073]TXD47715.1 SusC/RagA family TonB-linked outer membrane protein [Polaribacter sp. IC073]
MKKKLVILTILCFTLTVNFYSQEITVKGKVSDSSGELLGVSVLVKGTTKGTSTDFNGVYTIKAVKGDVLLFSYMGYKTKEIIISKSLLNVVLEEDSNALDEVVVTSFGIKRQKKSLGYAAQALKSEELLEGNQNNLVNTLQGKVSGVTITSSGGAPGASSVIMIRGGTSITGNNQPLMIVDGLPIDNSTDSSLEVASTNRASDLNPEDIESITVLKGPAAAALYGIQAAEGAVIITTKRGREGVSKVFLSSSLSVDNIIGTPSIQRNYGKGEQIPQVGGGVIYNDDSPLSWGEQIPSGTKTYNHIKDFYTTGVTQNHFLSYSGGAAKSNTYFSIGNLANEGVIPTTSYDKTTFRITQNSKLSEKLTLGISGNYIRTNINSTRQGNATGGSITSLLNYPSTVNAKDYEDADGAQKGFYTGQEFDNVYWSLENSPNTNELNRFIGSLGLDYAINKNLNLSYKFGADIYDQHSRRITANGSLNDTRSGGYISQYERLYKKYTSNFIATYDTQISSNFELNLLAGNTIEDSNVKTDYLTGKDFLAPGIYNISNISKENQSITERISRKRNVGVFGEIKLGYKQALFLNVTGRNDWSSTLPSKSRSFFYPSVGGSAVLTDLFNIKSEGNGLSYLKLRGTWAQVGKDAPIGQLESYLVTQINGLGSTGYAYNGVDVGNAALEPEFTNSWEIGFDSNFLNNRVSFNATYYKSVSDNQILSDIRVPPTAGTFYATLNGGEIENKGIEALLSVKLMPSTSDFQWTMNFNFGSNKTTVVDLPGELKEVYLSDSWTFLNSAAGAGVLNASLFSLRGKRALKNDDGEVLIEANGYPTLADETYTDVDRQPDFTLGVSSSMRYKNFGLSFLLDIVEGNTVYNATASALAFYGVGANTSDRGETTIIPGVKADGSINNISVTKDQVYYQDYYSRLSDNFVEDGSYTRLRYVSLNYQLGKNTINRLPISKLEFSLTGRNLVTFTNYSGVDPEINAFGGGIPGAGSVGVDNLGTPNTKGFDLGIKLTF